MDIASFTLMTDYAKVDALFNSYRVDAIESEELIASVCIVLGCPTNAQFSAEVLAVADEHNELQIMADDYIDDPRYAWDKYHDEAYPKWFDADEESNELYEKAWQLVVELVDTNKVL